MQDLRCSGRQLLAKLGDGFIEFSCKNVRCGKEPGVVVIHRFALPSGELVSTRLFKDPTSIINKKQERSEAHASGNRVPVRHP